MNHPISDLIVNTVMIVCLAVSIPVLILGLWFWILDGLKEWERDNENDDDPAGEERHV